MKENSMSTDLRGTAVRSIVMFLVILLAGACWSILSVQAADTDTLYDVVDSAGGSLLKVLQVPDAKVTAEGIVLSETRKVLRVGDYFTLKETVVPENAQDQRVQWKSSNRRVAAVSKKGRVTARGAGTAQITVKTKDGSYTAKCTVTVQVRKTIEVETGGKTSKGFLIADSASVTVRSRKKSVVELDRYGKLKAKKKGTTTITVTANDKSFRYSYRIKVIDSADVRLLAAIIQCEAGSEPYRGKVAVGAVVMNRVKSHSYPNTIRGVIYQRHQFSPASSGALSRVLRKGASSECIKAARDAMAGKNPIGNRMCFNNSRGHGYRIHHHYFY